MKNLYDVLEVSRYASNEIIEKAYKTLAKKYHPDLQEAEKKQEAEEMMKKINEAYSILSNEQSRKEYDEKLEFEEAQELNNKIKQSTNNVAPQSHSNQQKANYNQEASYNNETIKQYYEQLERQRKQNEELERKAQEEYRKGYIAYMRSLGYKIKHKWTIKDFIIIFAVIAILIFIGYILWIIPPSHNWLVELYNSNIVVKIFTNIIIGIVKGIGHFFTGLFKK